MALLWHYYCTIIACGLTYGSFLPLCYTPSNISPELGYLGIAQRVLVADGVVVIFQVDFYIIKTL